MISQHLLYSWFVVAGAAVLWRMWLNDHPSLKRWLNGLPRNIGKTLTCGSCFTYWFSLAYLILIDPLPDWTPLLRLSQPFFITAVLDVMSSWMAVAIGALTIRFGYVAIQEFVADRVHAREEHTHG